ncbi:EamA family transporter RarD [Paracoccus lutimaris]|uniref:Chloramphenicol-sensitive protein RarD n=1 Tax=Paracoccus lutimaris TaxID=1490030 RepID=A0A368Z6S7_9RHOB|nr:EamA family transporter RarD [Paracoccus lutimaris]RCW88123.1 chloramphenicol-sensitive protein RarD [Paracoccus lutimaris]
MSDWTKGFWAMITVCVTWGLSPIFYHALGGVPVLEVLAHRTIWSLALFLIILGYQRRLGALWQAITGPWAGRIALAALLVSANWGVFIWAVQAGHVVQSSLGYYIYPLIAVLLGVIVFRERLSRVQGLAVLLAMAAVMLLTWGLGVAPWISLALATTMGLYGVVKKSLPLGPVLSVAAEVALLTPLALIWLILQGAGVLPGTAPLSFGGGAGLTFLLVFSGVITAVPLVLFSYAARRVEMTTMGLMFYLNPTLQFLCAVAVFGEAVTRWHMIAFAMIWTAIAIYTAASIRQARRAAPLANG